MKFRATIPLILCALSASTLCAEVSYVRDLSGTENMDILLPQTKAPIDTFDPLYDPDLPDTQWIMTVDKLYFLEPQTGLVSDPKFLPDPTRVSPVSLSTMAGVKTTDPILRVLGSRRVLYTIRLDIDDPIVTGFVEVGLRLFHSMAAPDRTNLTILGTDMTSRACIRST